MFTFLTMVVPARCDKARQQTPRGHRIWRVCQAVPLLALLAVSASGADAKPKPVLTFSLTATNEHLAVHPERGFILGVWRIAPNDWDVDVSLAKDGENRRGCLLYGPLFTHGVHPSDITAWAHATGLYPDERVVRVHGYRRWIRIRLVDAQVSGGTNGWRFTGGRAEIYWQDLIRVVDTLTPETCE